MNADFLWEDELSKECLLRGIWMPDPVLQRRELKKRLQKEAEDPSLEPKDLNESGVTEELKICESKMHGIECLLSANVNEGNYGVKLATFPRLLHVERRAKRISPRFAGDTERLVALVEMIEAIKGKYYPNCEDDERISRLLGEDVAIAGESTRRSSVKPTNVSWGESSVRPNLIDDDFDEVVDFLKTKQNQKKSHSERVGKNISSAVSGAGKNGDDRGNLQQRRESENSSGRQQRDPSRMMSYGPRNENVENVSRRMPECLNNRICFQENRQENERVQRNWSEHRNMSDYNDKDMWMRPREMENANQSRFRGNLTGQLRKWGTTFDGRKENLFRFLNKVESLARAENVSDDELLDGGIVLFVGKGFDWFIGNSASFYSWQDLVAALKGDFLGHDYEYWLETEIDGRVQAPGEPLHSYLAEMKVLHRNLPYQRSPGRMIATIIRNMNPIFSNKIMPGSIRSLYELDVMCRNLETARANAARYNRISKNTAHVHEICEDKSSIDLPEKEVAAVRDFRQNGEQRRKGSGFACWNCDVEGHVFGDCPQVRKKFCYGCGKKDVVVTECSVCQKN